VDAITDGGALFPKRKYFGRFQEELVEDRRQRLEEYLSKVVATGDLVKLDSVQAFFNPLINVSAALPSVILSSCRPCRPCALCLVPWCVGW